MRRRGWPVLGTLIALLALGTLLLSACGGGSSSGGGGSAADDIVKQWVEGWQRSSGPQRDDITAGQMRLLLTGDLYDQAQAATKTGAAERLDKVYDKMMGLPFPPDGSYNIVSTKVEGDSATVVVSLTYTGGAAGSAASAGLIPFENVNDANQLVANSPQRTFTVKQVDKKWLIAAIAQ